MSTHVPHAEPIHPPRMSMGKKRPPGAPDAAASPVLKKRTTKVPMANPILPSPKTINFFSSPTWWNSLGKNEKTRFWSDCNLYKMKGHVLKSFIYKIIKTCFWSVSHHLFLEVWKVVVDSIILKNKNNFVVAEFFLSRMCFLKMSKTRILKFWLFTRRFESGCSQI